MLRFCCVHGAALIRMDLCGLVWSVHMVDLCCVHGAALICMDLCWLVWTCVNFYTIALALMDCTADLP